MTTKLYVIRHAEAEPREASATMPDEDRPLTSLGREQSRQIALALRRQGVALRALLHSPLLRARETAAGIHDHWQGEAPPLVECMPLAPGGKKRRLLKALEEVAGNGVAIVGHNPDLSELTAWLMGDKRTGIDLAKGAVACLEFEGRPAKSAGVLLWLVTPAWMSAE
jgi:phosphohistidine phosphatase